VSPTNCAHVAESDAEWLRQAIRDARAARCDDMVTGLLGEPLPPCNKPLGHTGAHRNSDGTMWTEKTRA
jgi:hypothetical protein